jgi:hypothetical protein
VLSRCHPDRCTVGRMRVLMVEDHVALAERIGYGLSDACLAVGVCTMARPPWRLPWPPNTT